MKARIRFYFSQKAFRLTPELIRELNEMGSSSSEKNTWMEVHKQEVGLPDNFDFIYWNRDRGLFYMQDGNGRQHHFTNNGFNQILLLPDPEKFWVCDVSANVFFYSSGTFPSGIYEKNIDGRLVTAVVDWEPVEGFPRYSMIVQNASSLVVLADFVDDIRSCKITPKTLWP